MLSKLAFRNVKRSVRDYMVYLLTLMVITGLMFAFNTMLFLPDIQKMGMEATILAVMLGIATFFIFLINAWLINYMVRFMMEKRSREFGTYLLLGMKRKQLANLYIRENVILGCIAFVLGLVLGIFLQQILMSIFYRLFGGHYRLTVIFDKYCLLMTFGCFFGCFLLALLRNKRKFKKMNISYLMNLERVNEEINERGVKTKQWFFFLSVGYFIFFNVFVLGGDYGGFEILLLILLLFVSVYLFYIGLSAFLVCYIKKGGNKIYKKSNLFLLRQMASKIKTMQVTMGTLSVLFIVALLGCTVAMMFSDYQNKQMAEDFPFDIMIHEDHPGYDFKDELALIEENAHVKDIHQYSVYQNNTNARDFYLYTHLQAFGSLYKTDETPDLEGLKENYGTYDSYMAVSDYNYLRNMLGLSEVSLQDGQYLIHMSERVYREIEKLEDVDEITAAGSTVIGGKELTFAGYYREAFGQNGHNGADYIVVVPDWTIDYLEEYYSQLVLSIEETEALGLQDILTAQRIKRENNNEFYDALLTGYGSKQIIVFTDDILVQADLIPQMKFILTSISFPLIYIGLVFLCVALTILSVQQLSDSAKYKFRYSVLRKMGMSEHEIDRIILKQLFLYYLCPVLAAVAVSAVAAMYASERFIFYTGVETSTFYYYGLSLLVFVGVYLIYFAMTYVSFKRNVVEE